MSSASTPRWLLTLRKGGRRPRGSRPIDPSTIQRSASSSSTISEMVLRCRPETRARSAREIGCLVRIWLKIRLRLICRGVLFEALTLLVNEKRGGGALVRFSTAMDMLVIVQTLSGSNVVGCGRDTAAPAGPVGVEELAARLIDALIRVSAEKVALRLQQICRQALRPVSVVEGQGG